MQIFQNDPRGQSSLTVITLCCTILLENESQSDWLVGAVRLTSLHKERIIKVFLTVCEPRCVRGC